MRIRSRQSELISGVAGVSFNLPRRATSVAVPTVRVCLRSACNWDVNAAAVRALPS